MIRITVVLAAILFQANVSIGQEITVPKPRQQQLLNGLDVLTWSRSDTDIVTVKLRVHSGSAYDPQDKEGVAALLTDILFPDEGIANFFKEDLGGEITIDINYDYIQITASARSDAFLTVLETIAPAVTNPIIDKETTEKVKEKRLALISELAADPSYVARRSVASRLFGSFPYGRAVEGTPESLDQIDFADLIFAKERYLTADNATLTIEGNVKSDYAYLAARRLFGGWRKAAEPIPATFRIPAPPSPETEVVFAAGEPAVRDCYAVEGFSKPDRDRLALEIALEISKGRLAEMASGNIKSVISAEHFGYFLKGLVIVSIADTGGGEPDAGTPPGSASKELFEKLFSYSFKPEEFARAKSALTERLRKRSPSDFWLDKETYRLKYPDEEVRMLRNVTLADVKKAADTISRRKGASLILLQRPSQEASAEPDQEDPS